MPTDKDFKRLIRARMARTGEAYTAARAQLLARDTSPDRTPAQLGGMSDEAVSRATGHSWQAWVDLLDAEEAWLLPHKSIAEKVHQQYEVSRWWAQSVTVGYERIKGLRAVGQRRDGTYEANKSKTLTVPVAKLYGAFSNSRARRRWLSEVEPTIRTATKDKSMRWTWPDGTSVHLYFTAKSDSKSRIAIQLVDLASGPEVDRVKQFWAERLEALAELLVPAN